MRLNLSPIRRIAESLTMGDTLKFTRDASLTADDTWNETTGVYTPPVGDRATIYSGPGGIYSPFPVPTEDEQGEEDIAVVRYILAIPVSASVDIHPEDQCEITAVDADDGDPQMVGKVLVVRAPIFGTLSATRRFSAELYSPIP